jgi:hypothetical protein
VKMKECCHGIVELAMDRACRVAVGLGMKVAVKEGYHGAVSLEGGMER